MLPMVVFFPACSCGKDNSTPTEPNQYTVYFYTNSADTFNISSQTVEEGNLIRRPDTPTKKGYNFIGWYSDSALTKVWTFEIDTVHKNMTLYARWEKRV